MKNMDDQIVLTTLLTNSITPLGYKLTKDVGLDPIPESVKYDGMSFSLNDNVMVYRKANVTENRPGAFLAIWKRPAKNAANNKPIPLDVSDLDYLFIGVSEYDNKLNDEPVYSKRGLFIFPASILIKKGILSSDKKKGKTGFRVFPPWSDDRGVTGTNIFSDSGKKTQAWQLPYFIEINCSNEINSNQIEKIIGGVK